MHPLIGAVMLWSVLLPQKGWFAPDQPDNVQIKAGKDVTLVLTDFAGKALEPKGSADATDGQTVDAKAIFPALTAPGTFVLYALPKGSTAPAAGGPPPDFLGTPVVFSVRQDTRAGAPGGPEVTKVEPLRYAVMTTDYGPMTMVFYYDVAPNTVDNFLTLCEEGYYDGLTFHRIVPGFVLQGGDPKGDGTGGPGYHIEAEFNDRPHEEGVLSMAREGDANERAGGMPGPVAANSAGSQFFICLDYQTTQQLDHKYTAFGKVVQGLDAVHKMAQVKIADPQTNRPEKPPVIQKVDVLTVQPGKNPYTAIMTPSKADASNKADTSNK